MYYSSSKPDVDRVGSLETTSSSFRILARSSLLIFKLRSKVLNNLFIDVKGKVYITKCISLYNMATETEVLHYPNLKTVLMVEKVLRSAETAITRTELKEKLPKEIMHQTLNLILQYLEERGMLADTHKGIIWLYNPSLKLNRAISKGAEH